MDYYLIERAASCVRLAANTRDDSTMLEQVSRVITAVKTAEAAERRLDNTLHDITESLSA